MATDVSYFEVEGDSTLYQFNDPDAETALTALNQRLQTAEGNITTLQGDVTTLDESVTDVQGDVATLQGDVSTAQGNISTLQGDVSTAQGDITDLQGDVADLQNASGTEGDWTWVRIGNIVICTITILLTNVAITTSANGEYYGQVDTGVYPPSVLKSVINTFATVGTGSTSGGIRLNRAILWGPGSSNTISVILASNTSRTGSNYAVSFMAIGSAV